MDDLIKQLQEKTGLPVDKVKDVIDTVIGFVADKLPGPLAGQVRKLVGGDDDGDAEAGDDDGGGLLDQAKGALGGLLGND